MTKTKKCDIWISHDNPVKVYCFACKQTFATLDLPMNTDVLKSVCDAYKERCEQNV